MYWAASTDPATAMPTAAPTSRVVSLTADATPCFSSGTAFMIAEVVGATHNPMPALVMSIGHDEVEVRRTGVELRACRTSPAAMRNSPSATAVRSPIFGR